jgi:hypothetical protein
VGVEGFAVLTGVVAWCVLALGAPGCLLWAMAATRRKRLASTLSLCLWCAVAGGALSGGLWSWMTTTNWQFLAIQASRATPGAPPMDFERESMSMLKFFVHLDRTLGRLLYATVLVPLVGSILVYRRAFLLPVSKAKSAVADDEFSTPPY